MDEVYVLAMAAVLNNHQEIERAVLDHDASAEEVAQLVTDAVLPAIRSIVVKDAVERVATTAALELALERDRQTYPLLQVSGFTEPEDDGSLSWKMVHEERERLRRAADTTGPEAS